MNGLTKCESTNCVKYNMDISRKLIAADSSFEKTRSFSLVDDKLLFID